MLPVAAFAVSVLIGLGGYGEKRNWLLPLAFGAMYMLAEYATFTLANMISFSVLRLPHLSLLLRGTVVSAAGFWFGALLRSRRKRREESGKPEE